MAKILIIEDDLVLSRLIKALLESKGNQVDIENDGKLGLDRILTTDYSIILLDLSLPTIDGLQILSEMRRADSHTPVIIITGDVSDENELICFRKGTNLFHKKPIRSRLLLYQIQSLIHEGTNSMDITCYKELKLDEHSKIISILELPLSLTKLEYELLRLLIKQNPNTLSKRNIISTLYSEGDYVQENSVDTTVSRIRKKMYTRLLGQSKLDPETEIIQTVRGFGFRLY